MQDLCLLLGWDLQFEADMNPVADTHTQEWSSPSMHCTVMKCEQSEQSKFFAHMNMAFMNYLQEMHSWNETWS